MANQLLDLIARAEGELAGIQSDLDTLTRKAKEDDGAITEDDEEFREIQSLTKKLGQANKLLQTKKDEFAADKAAWEAALGDLLELEDKIKTLRDWGEPEIENVAKLIGDVNAAVEEQRYKDALTTFQSAQRSSEPLYDEYTLQFAAKKTYEDELALVEGQRQKLRDVGVDNETTRVSDAQIDTNLSSADAHAKVRDYVEALTLLRMNGPEMVRLETEVHRLDGARTETDALLVALDGRITDVEGESAGFDVLLPRFDQVHASRADIDKAIADNDFSSAQGQIRSVDYELDAIRAEIKQLAAQQAADEARKKAEREEWERRAPRWAAFCDKVAELKEWKDPAEPELFGHVGQITSHVDSEEFALACEGLEQAETALGQPWSRHMEQVAAKGTYEKGRPSLDQRAAEVGTSPHVDDNVMRQLAEIDATLKQMADSATAMDYLKASAGIEGAAAALDAAEQTKRENRVRAEEAERLGLDPNTSDPALEAAITKRLYEEERGALEDRVAAGSQTEAMGKTIETAIVQLETDLVSIKTIADGGDLPGALEAIRSATAEMGKVDELIREQEERKRRYEAELKAVSDEAARLEGSPLQRIVSAAGHVTNDIGKAEAFAGDGDYEAALAKLDDMAKELDRIERESDDLTRLKRDAEASLGALAPGLEAADKNTFPEVDPAAKLVVDKWTEVGRLLEAEEFAAAIGEIGVLEGMVAEFQKEAESAKLHKRYTDAVVSLDIDARLAAMRVSIYPEADTQKQSVENKDSERLDREKNGDWGPAWDAVYDESDLLGEFDSEIKAIESAKISYESESPGPISKSETMFPEEKDDTGTVARYQAELSGVRATMEKAVQEHRYLEALKTLQEFVALIDEAEKAVRDLFQAPDGQINDFIAVKMQLARTAVIGGLLSAINRFETFVLARITAERDGQKAARRVNYVLDIGSALLALGGPVAQGWAAGLSVVKVFIEGAATEIDDELDEGDKQAAHDIVNKLRKGAKELEQGWNPSQGPWFKSNRAEDYKKIGNKLYFKDEAGASAILKSGGVPFDASMSDAESIFYADLVKQFTDQRGK